MPDVIDVKARANKTKWVSVILTKDYGKFKKGHIFPKLGEKHAKLFTDTYKVGEIHVIKDKKNSEK